MGDRKESPINPPSDVIKSRERLMGFQLLFELVLQDENGDQSSAYLCKLCGWITRSDRLFKHLESFRHRLLYLVSGYVLNGRVSGKFKKNIFNKNF